MGKGLFHLWYAKGISQIPEGMALSLGVRGWGMPKGPYRALNSGLPFFDIIP